MSMSPPVWNLEHFDRLGFVAQSVQSDLKTFQSFLGILSGRENKHLALQKENTGT